MLKRREFLVGAGAAALGLRFAFAEQPGFVPGTKTSFPVLSVQGEPGEVGFQIGKRFGRFIELGLKRRRDWFKPLVDFSKGRGKKTIEAMQTATEKHAGPALEELKGWAKGSGIDFHTLLVLNCKSELDAFMQRDCGCPGCSTVVVQDKGRLIVAHNEDGNDAYQDLMFLLRILEPGAPAAMALTYPGILSGMAPWMNDRGILMTTTYIPSRKVVPGVPRYFLNRMAMRATTVEDAAKWVTHPARAYAFHHVIADLKTGQALSVEGNPDKLVQRPIEGVFWHTNHLVRPDMKDEPQFEDYMKASSLPRYEALTRALSGKKTAEIDGRAVMTAMSDHKNSPYGVCRHPKGEVHGATLATALFQVAPPVEGPYPLRLYRNNPCMGRFEDWSLEAVQ